MGSSKEAMWPKNRSVSADFFNPDLYPCIRCSVAKDGLYCIACILFGSQLSNYARQLISKHQKTSDHKLAQQRSVDL